MKGNYMESLKLEQETLREDLWNIFIEKGYTIARFSRELGIAHQTLSSFFRGACLNRMTEIKLNAWLKNYKLSTD